MSFRPIGVGLAALATVVAGCSAALPEPVLPDPANPQAPTAAMPYRPVLAGTAPHAPAELKPWRELNEGVASGSGP